MRLIGRLKLEPLSVTHPTWVNSWVAEVCNATWKCPSDVSGQFPKASYHEGCFLFPVSKSQIAVHVFIAFAQGVALVVAVKTLQAANGH